MVNTYILFKLCGIGFVPIGLSLVGNYLQNVFASLLFGVFLSNAAGYALSEL
jgi:hypothetical protein